MPVRAYIDRRLPWMEPHAGGAPGHKYRYGIGNGNERGNEASVLSHSTNIAWSAIEVTSPWVS
jgi:hypothetical protein